jgi:ketosteroid isomerase-like protein
MHENADLIRNFYTSFQARDADGMNACYHIDIVFSDPAFGTLKGVEATSMWRMLCERGKDLDLEFGNIHADSETGHAHWEAWYTFSKSGRRVHNIIEAFFTLKDGKIIRHIDRFNLWRWSSMALGPLGTFLGWTPFVQSAIRKEARQGLEKFMEKARKGGIQGQSAI